MKNTIFIVLAFLPLLVFSQKEFEGKIVYSINNEKGDSMVMYFASGWIRSEMSFAPLQNAANRFSYLLVDLEKKDYYMINDSQKTITKLIYDSLTTSQFKQGQKNLLKTIKMIKGFECYGISEIKEDTFNIMDNDVIIQTRIDTWFAKDLYFPYQMEYLFNNGNLSQEKNIYLLTEVQLDVKDATSNGQVIIAATTVEQTKLPASLFQIPTTYKMNYEKLSNVLNTKTELKVTDMKFKEIDSIPPPPPTLLNSPAKKEKQKPVKG